MIPKALKDVLLEDLLSLVVNEASEARALDFKRELPGRDDASKREFYADISAFANSGGGDIVYGIEDVDGKAVAAPGLGKINADEEIRRLQQMSLHVEPRIRIYAQEVAGPDRGPFIILRVEDSTAGPHAFKISDGTYRFFARADRAKYPMSLDQIKAAFMRSGSIREQIQGFRAQRKLYLTQSIPLPLSATPWLQAQIIPFSAFSGGPVLPAALLGEMNQDVALLSYTVERSNVDGFLRYHADSGQIVRYCQAFRNGCLEFVETQISYPGKPQPALIGGAVDLAVVRAVGRGFKFLLRMGIGPPLAVYLTLANVKGYAMYADQSFTPYDRETRKIDRPVVEATEIFVDDLDSDSARLVKPALDIFWEASGNQRSLSYDEAGEWNRKPWI